MTTTDEESGTLGLDAASRMRQRRFSIEPTDRTPRYANVTSRSFMFPKSRGTALGGARGSFYRSGEFVPGLNFLKRDKITTALPKLRLR